MDSVGFISSRIGRAVRTVVLMFFATVSVGGQARAQTLVNGSFETEDYEGWTLFEDVYNSAWGPFEPTSGTWGLAMSGSTMNSNDSADDYSDHISVTQTSQGLPITFQSTDGNVVAFHLQNAAGIQRLSQDILLASNAELLEWDMQYNNHSLGGFDPLDPWPNYLAVHFRDPVTNNLLKTLYQTTQGVDDWSIPMTPFYVDITEFAGQAVRLEVELKNAFWFDLVLDNFRISPDPVVEVTLDVELSARKRINLKSNGVVAIAIHGSSSFEAITEIDLETLRFGPGGAMPVHKGHVGDMNGDGFWDAIVHVRVPDLGFDASELRTADRESRTLSLCVDGETLDDARIQGCTDVTVAEGSIGRGRERNGRNRGRNE